MLLRGLVRRVPVAVPKATTNNLPQLARLLQRFVLSRNVSTLRPLPRALSVAIADLRRTYATKSTTTVKKATKKTTAKKSAAKKTAKKAPKKKKATKAKKKGAPRKKVVRKKKALTPEEELKQTVRVLKRKALRPPNSSRATSPLNIIVRELSSGKKVNVASGGVVREAADKLHNLSPAELEHYNRLANEETAKHKKEYMDWVHSHTSTEIRSANRARSKLKKLLPDLKSSIFTQKIHDDRAASRPVPAFAQFTRERWASGDFKGIVPAEASKLIGSEWKSLSDSEKKKYAA